MRRPRLDVTAVSCPEEEEVETVRFLPPPPPRPRPLRGTTLCVVSVWGQCVNRRVVVSRLTACIHTVCLERIYGRFLFFITGRI